MIKSKRTVFRVVMMGTLIILLGTLIHFSIQLLELIESAGLDK